MKIPYYQRFQPHDQMKFLEGALLSEDLFSDGKYADFVKNYFNETLSISHLLLTTSATSALELALQLLDLAAGDEVILPSFTFPSAANAVLKAGARPVFCDINLVTKNMDMDDAGARITPRTKAIIPTHYAGISCDMGALMSLCKEHRLALIEDAAQGTYSFYKGAPLGTLGDFGVYSFHHTKNFSCGEGGALLCKDINQLKRGEVLRDNGTNRGQFMRGEIPAYSWQTTGSNYVLNEASAALLYSQLLAHNEILSRRQAVAQAYEESISLLAETHGEKISPMVIPPYATPNYHIYYVDCGSEAIRNSLKGALLREGIDVRTHFVPLHLSAFGETLGYKAADYPKSLHVSKTLLRLPLHTGLTENQVAFVLEKLTEKVKRL